MTAVRLAPPTDALVNLGRCVQCGSRPTLGAVDLPAPYRPEQVLAWCDACAAAACASARRLLPTLTDPTAVASARDILAALTPCLKEATA